MRLILSVALAATTLPLVFTAPINPSSLPATSDNAPISPEIEHIVARADAAEAKKKKGKKQRPENAPMIMAPFPDENTPYPPWIGEPGTPAYDFPGSGGSKGHWTMPAQPLDDPDEPGVVWFADEKRDLDSDDGGELDAEGREAVAALFKSVGGEIERTNTRFMLPSTTGSPGAVEARDVASASTTPATAPAQLEDRDAAPSPQSLDEGDITPLLGPGCIETSLYGRWCPGDGPMPLAVGTGKVSENVDRRDAVAIPPVSSDANPTFETLSDQPAPLVLRRDNTESPSRPYVYKAGADFLPCIVNYHGKIHEGELHDNGDCVIKILQKQIIQADEEDRGIGPGAMPYNEFEDRPVSDFERKRQKGHMKGNGNCVVGVQDEIGEWHTAEMGDKDIMGVLDMDGNWHRHAKHATFPWMDKNGRYHIHPHPRLSERRAEDGLPDPIYMDLPEPIDADLPDPTDTFISDVGDLPYS